MESHAQGSDGQRVSFGLGRNNSSATQDPFGLNTLADFGFKGVQDSPIYSGGISGIDISRAAALRPRGPVWLQPHGSPDFLPKFKTNQFQWTDTLSWVHGAHQFKFGGEIRGPMRNIYLDVPGLRGGFTFDGNPYWHRPGRLPARISGRIAAHESQRRGPATQDVCRVCAG
jgi:hypothetical protein